MKVGDERHISFKNFLAVTVAQPARRAYGRMLVLGQQVARRRVQFWVPLMPSRRLQAHPLVQR